MVRSHIPWPSPTSHRTPTAGVNSFGYGGANSHCILERSKSRRITHVQISKDVVRSRSLLLPISAKSARALPARVEDLASMDLSRINISDLAYTLAERRTPFNWRGFLVAKPETLSIDVSVEAFKPTTRESCADPLPLVFIFTGQGTQWPKIGKQLFEYYAKFHYSITQLEEYLAQLPEPPSWSLKKAILASPVESNINDSLISQTACAAIQIALVDLLYSWDVFPTSVVGHSSGEIAAAYTAGYLNSLEAISAAYVRGQVVRAGTLKGAMIAVGASSEQAQKWIHNQNYSNQITVACVNSPESVTLSGDADAIETLQACLQRDGIFTRSLKTGGKAYHSSHMKSIGENYELQLSYIFRHRRSSGKGTMARRSEKVRRTVSMISSIHARPVSPEVALEPSYWRANLESPVMFSSAVEMILKNQDSHFVEIGPHSTLELPVRQTRSYLKKGENKAYFSALYRNRDSEQCLLPLMGNLWTVKYPVNYTKVNKLVLKTYSVLTNLPNYR